jgi:S1-C subfamily serine protease
MRLYIDLKSPKSAAVVFSSIRYCCCLVLMSTNLIGGVSFCLTAQAVSPPEQGLDYVGHSTQAVTYPPEVGVSAPEIAKQVTVRILTKSGSGSGVIVKRDGQIYTVLTNHHVVADSPEKDYQVLTFDGQMYQARGRSEAKFGTLDLALVEFTSNGDYQVVVFGKSQAVSEGEIVYAAGFPAWHFTWTGDMISRFEETRHWGVRAFQLTTGTLKMQLAKTLPGGYQIGYTNDVTQGMSGGPVLNQKGELIAINGLLKYPFQGINAFIFADGDVPDEQLYQQMEALSWAIPIANISSLLEEPKTSDETGL